MIADAKAAGRAAMLASLGGRSGL